MRVVEQLDQPAALVELRPGGQVGRVVLPGARPRRPAPDQRIAREEVARVGDVRALSEVASRDRRHAWIVAVAGEQFFTEPEEGGVGVAVVLEHDRLIDEAEDPVEPGLDAAFEAETPVGVVRHHLALEPGSRYNLAGLFAQRSLFGAVWTVGDHEDLARARSADDLDEPAGQLGSRVDEQRDGRAKPELRRRRGEAALGRREGRCGGRGHLVEAAGEVQEVDFGEGTGRALDGARVARMGDEERKVQRLVVAPDVVEAGVEPAHHAGPDQFVRERAHLVVESGASVFVPRVHVLEELAVVRR